MDKTIPQIFDGSEVDGQTVRVTPESLYEYTGIANQSHLSAKHQICHLLELVQYPAAITINWRVVDYNQLFVDFSHNSFLPEMNWERVTIAKWEPEC